MSQIDITVPGDMVFTPGALSLIYLELRGQSDKAPGVGIETLVNGGSGSEGCGALRQSKAVLENGPGGRASLSRKGLLSLGRRLSFTCVCLGVPRVWAGGKAGSSELWCWGRTAWAGCLVLAFLCWRLAACYPLCFTVFTWDVGTL